MPAAFARKPKISMSGSLFNSDGTPRRKPVYDVLRHIAGFVQYHDEPGPTVAQIAEDLGMTAEQVCRRLRWLQAAGWIALSRQRAGGRPLRITLLRLPVFRPVPQAPWFDTEAALLHDWGGVLPAVQQGASTSHAAVRHA